MPKCVGLPDADCPKNQTGRSVENCQGDLMLCPDCEDVRFPDHSRKSIQRRQRQQQTRIEPTALPLTQHDTDQSGGTVNMSDAGSLSAFERLSAAADVETFTSLFTDNLTNLYEYDKKELMDFLQGLHLEESALKEKLLSLRLVLYENLCALFPMTREAVMFNRRKADLIIEDIFILGFCLVNKSQDKRLAKVLKQPLTSDDHPHEVTLSADNPTDLIETCIVLRDTVTCLTSTVSTLTREVTTLREKVALLEVHMASDTATATITRPNECAVMQNDLQPDDSEDDTPEEQDTILIPPSGVNTNTGPDTGSDSTPDQPTHSSEGDFQLPADQRRDILRGSNVQTLQRQEITGSASRTFQITGVIPASRPTICVYIGRVKGHTKPDNIRRHLQDVGVSHVTDVIQLPCKISNFKHISKFQKF